MMRVLVLRPEPGAGETMRRARKLRLDPVSIPLFAVEPIAWEVPDPAHFDALLLTSANTVRHASDGLMQLRSLPVHAVGGATAEAARNAGFDIASIGDAGIDRLCGSIDPKSRLLHLCGEDRKAIRNTHQAVTAIAVYRAKPLPDPDLSGTEGSVALIHSPRAGRRFAQLVKDRETIAIAAISQDAATACGSGWKIIEAADKPSDDALLALAARLCNNSTP